MTKSITESSAAILSRLNEEKPVKVLHVDDDLGFLKVAKQCLEIQGEFQVETASSVEEAIEKMKKKRYDAIVSDYQMPEKDGLQFLEELRKKGNNIPFIMFTGKGREEIAVKALNLGADHYLDKTGDPEIVYSELSHDIANMVRTRRAEQELRIQREELQTILDSLPLQIWYKDKNNRLVRVNKRFAEYMGLSKKDLEGKPLGDLFPPDIALKCWEEDKEVIETGQPKVDILDRHESAQGSRWFLTSKVPYKDRDGKIIGTINFSSDITERKNAETSPTDHALLESLVESSDDAIIGKTLDGTIVSWNSGAQKIYGYAPEEVIGKSISILIPPEAQEEVPKILDRIKRGEHVDRYYTKRVKKDHSRIDVSITVSPIKDRKGNIIGSSTIARDITERKKAQEQLRDSEKKYRELFETSIDAIATSDMSGHFIDCNQSCLKMLGYTLDEMRNLTYQQLTPEKWHKKEAEIIERNVMKKGYTAEYEKEQIRKDGTIIPVSNRVWATYDNDGKPKAMWGIVRDITERKKAERELLIKDNAIASSIDGMAIADLQGNVTYVNPVFVKMWGYNSDKEVLGKSLAEMTRKGQSKEKADEIVKALGTKGGWAGEITATRKDGSKFYSILSASLVKDEADKPICMLGSFVDITERKKSEQTLRASLERHRSFIEATGELGWTTNPEGEVVEDIPSFRKFTGQNYEEVKGWGWSKALHPDDVKRTTKIWKEATRTKGVYEIEYRLRRHDGVYRYFMARGVPALEEDGSIREWVGTCIDITERKMTEDELRSSQERLKILFESAPDAYYMNDLKGNFIDGNEAAQKITGYDRNELVGKSFLKLKLLPRSQILKAAKLLALNAAGKPTGPDEFTLNRKDGTQVPVEIRTYPVRINNKTVVLAIARDITERKKAETLVLESQQRFQSLFSNNPEATIYTDVDFTVVDVNQRFTTLFGYSSNEVKGKNINDLIVSRDHVEEAEMLGRKAMEGYAHSDTVRMRKDKSLVSVSISAAPVIVRDQLEGYVGVYKDISRLKKAEEELRETMEKLQVMNEKLRVVGSLTRHDIRNKLTAVTGNTYLARKKLPENSEVLEYLGQIEASAEQTVRVLDFAKTYEMLGVEQLDFVDVEKTINDAISLHSGLNEIKVMNDCHGLTVLADSLLRQLFYNLIDDSLKYGKKLTSIRIHYEEKSDHLNIIYEDDGVGIPASEKPKLFNQGYSTGGSTGYGLYLIKKMTEVYGWTIKENGEAGRGAVFFMTIPKTNESHRTNYKLH